jgi:nucleoside 2-deoxyribosyltransferase
MDHLSEEISVAIFRGRPACLVAIPEGPEYAEIGQLIYLSLKDLNVEEIRSPCKFTPYLLEECMKADFLIADITETNPSTYFLIGAAQASQKPVLLLSMETSSAPTEISGFKVVQYNSVNVKRISELLRLFISDFLSEATTQE